MKNTAELADAAIVRSIRLHITRENALRQILRRIPLAREKWMTLQDAREKRGVLFRCVLHLIPYREPNRINANFKGTIRNARKRIRLMKKRFDGNGKHDPFALLKKPLKQS